MTTKNILVHFDFMTMVNMALLILLHTLLQTHFQNNHILQACSTWGLLWPASLLGFVHCPALRIVLLQNCHWVGQFWWTKSNVYETCLVCHSLKSETAAGTSFTFSLHLVYIGFTFTSIHICFTFDLTHIYFSTQVQFNPIWVPNTCFYVLNNINHEAHNQGYVELQKKSLLWIFLDYVTLTCLGCNAEFTQ